MPKVVSNKQVAANRRNARKSTGPTTPAGKARSRRNALKHGLLAREVIICDGDGLETRADFDALLTDLQRELKPRTVVEETLVERIATSYWRLRRAQRYEVGAIRESLDECSRRDESDPQLTKLQRKLDRTRTELADEQQLLAYLQDPPELPDDQARTKHDEILKKMALRLQIDTQCLTPNRCGQALLEPQRRVVDEIRDEITDLRSRIKEARRYADLRKSRRPLLASLPVQDTLIKLVRYETMLDRQLHRALAELRRRRSSTGGPSRPALTRHRSRSTRVESSAHFKSVRDASDKSSAKRNAPQSKRSWRRAKCQHRVINHRPRKK